MVCQSGFRIRIPQGFLQPIDKTGGEKGDLDIQFSMLFHALHFSMEVAKISIFFASSSFFEKRHDNLTLKGTKQHRFCINICQSKEEGVILNILNVPLVTCESLK